MSGLEHILHTRLRGFNLQMNVIGIHRRIFGNILLLGAKGDMEAVGGEHHGILQQKESGQAYHDQQQQDQKDDFDPVPLSAAGTSVTVVISHSRSPFKSSVGDLSA